MYDFFPGRGGPIICSRDYTTMSEDINVDIEVMFHKIIVDAISEIVCTSSFNYAIYQFMTLFPNQMLNVDVLIKGIALGSMLETNTSMINTSD